MPTREWHKVASCQTEPGEKTQMSPNSPRPICSETDRVISTFSFDPDLEPCPHNLHRGRPAGHLSQSPERLGHLPGGGLRSSGMPHEDYADPITNDGPRFHSDIPVSELTERDTQAIEASGVSSTPPVAKTMDGVRITKTSRPSTGPPLRVGARGKLDSQGDRMRGHRTMA